MGVARDLLGQIDHLLRPIRNRIANSIARAVITNVTDSAKLQLLQLEVLEGEVIDDGESFQAYGFFSVPLVGAEAIVIFPNGDRGHPLVVGTGDRRHRPTGGQPGEAGLYSDEGDEIRLARGNTICVKTNELLLGGAAAVDGVIKGTARNTAEQTFLTALSTWVAAVGVTVPAATATFQTAITAFANAAAAAVSSKVKSE